MIKIFPNGCKIEVVPEIWSSGELCYATRTAGPDSGSGFGNAGIMHLGWEKLLQTISDVEKQDKLFDKSDEKVLEAKAQLLEMGFLHEYTVPSEPNPQNMQDIVSLGIKLTFSVAGRDK